MPSGLSKVGKGEVILLRILMARCQTSLKELELVRFCYFLLVKVFDKSKDGFGTIPGRNIKSKTVTRWKVQVPIVSCLSSSDCTGTSVTELESFTMRKKACGIYVPPSRSPP